VLTVEDEGPGIAPQDLPYVFERFYRAEEHSRRIKGSGLGLTIVKAFVELCDGKVSVESSPRGTRFMIVLPAVVSEKVSA
jgi:signal transduction histidine kinase